jgi:hypothetical protein
MQRRASSAVSRIHVMLEIIKESNVERIFSTSVPNLRVHSALNAL